MIWRTKNEYMHNDTQAEPSLLAAPRLPTARDVARWRREHGRLLFVLRKDDLVEMISDPKDPASSRRIYRTVSFSGTGGLDLEFLPVEEDRAPKQVPKPVRTRITTVTAFNNRRPQMILLDSTGRERWRSQRLN